MFAYRWLLLDCKREFPFKDVFHVFETLWASLPAERFELNNGNTFSDGDDLCPLSLYNQHHLSIYSAMSNRISLSDSCSSRIEESQSQRFSLDADDSDYRDEHISNTSNFNLHSQKFEYSLYLTAQTNTTTKSFVALGKWLTHFSSINDDESYSDMFTIFLCVALLEQNRLSIMQMSLTNTDNDDLIGSYFTRLVRQHDAQCTLQLARNYHRQYVLFQMRVKQLLSTDN